MPVHPTFPGIYVQELSASTHTITAAPTSIAVFIGYTHPYKTKFAPGSAVEVFNFTEYQAAFGGVFKSDKIPTELPYAIEQFFLNGGAQAYIIPLEAKLTSSTGIDAFVDNPPQVILDGAIFKGLELVDSQTPLTVTVKNVRVDPLAPLAGNMMFDLIVTYGSIATETFRGLSLVSTSPNFVDTRLNNGKSTLVTISPSGASYTQFTGDHVAQPLVYSTAFTSSLAEPTATVFNPADYINQLSANTPLDKIDIFNLLVMPAVSDNSVLNQAIPFVEGKRAFMIIDCPSNVVADHIASPVGTTMEEYAEGIVGTPPPRTDHGAIYFPWLAINDELTRQPRRLPPSGYVAGVYARTDNDRGVWKAPAGLETVLVNTSGVVADGVLTDARAGILNDDRVNALRTFRGVGTVVFGARTFVPSVGGAMDQWKYVPVRRMALFLEQTLVRNLGWVIFEPNDEPLWLSIRTSIEAFMLSLFRQGAFQGDTPDKAFQVKCDASTTTQQDIDNGIVNILVAFAPLKPAEFVVIQIAQLAGQAQT